MKARTIKQNGSNKYEIYFAYEDYYGGEIFRSYDEMQRNGIIPNTESKKGHLVAFLHSFYWGCTERIDMLPLNERPDVSTIKDFINKCKSI